MMNKKQNWLKMLPIAAIAFASVPANAAITLLDKDDTTVSVDASFNTFYVNSSIDKADGTSRDQSRVKAGFLPNWIGFNFSKQVDGLKLGGRSSFWVSTNDSNNTVTDSTIDVRQFYGTVDADWGQVLIGKDFTLFARNNIFMDEILLGYGYTSDALGLVDTNGVSFGNIGAGYPYPLPTSQIRYTSPNWGGFKMELALVDPTDTSSSFGGRGEESAPRIEGQFTYAAGPFTGWVGFMDQSSESASGVDVGSSGISYGAKLKFDFGLAIHASGYDGEGVGLLVGPADAQGVGVPSFVYADGDEVDSKGTLLQASYAFGASRIVVSTGKSELEIGGVAALENENSTLGYFHAVNSNLTLVAELSESEFNNAEETKTVALGAIINF